MYKCLNYTHIERFAQTSASLPALFRKTGKFQLIIVNHYIYIHIQSRNLDPNLSLLKYVTHGCVPMLVFFI